MWTNEETQIAIELIKQGESYEKIGSIIGKTGKAVKVKLLKLGYKITDYLTYKKYTIVICLNCGIEIEGGDRKFCNNSCSAIYNNTKRHLTIGYSTKKKRNNCLNCNKEVKIIKSKFCSNVCFFNYEWIKKKKEIEQGKIKSTSALRKYILERDGHQCKICKITEWEKNEVPLVLDHINGDSYNNLPNNLRLICPNCDAQTDTYKGRNRGNGRHERMKRYHNKLSY